MSTPVDPREAVAFPRFTPEQLAIIEQRSRCRVLADGEALWRVGEKEFCFYTVKKGGVQIVEESSGDCRAVALHEPNEFTGDIDLLSGRASVVSGFAVGETHILEMPAEDLRVLVQERHDIGEIVLRAFLMRRELLLEQGVVGTRVIGSHFSADTLRVREFLARNRIPFTWTDLERNEDTERMIRLFNVCEGETPVVVLQDGRILRNPDNAQLGDVFGIRRTMSHDLYDFVVVGAGPAGLAAAVYGASEGLKTLLLDRVAPGGQAGTSSRIENYMGFPNGVSGSELANHALVQAEKFGAQLSVPVDVRAVECDRGIHLVRFSDGEAIEAKCVLLAMGAKYRQLDVPGFESLNGNGVYYAATAVEAQLCRNEVIGVVGAGNSAGQAAVFLSQSVRKVYMIVRGRDLASSMSNYLIRRIEQTPNIEVLVQTQICDVQGDASLEGLIVSGPEGTRSLPITSLFVFIGAVPPTNWLPQELTCTNKGFILTGPAAKESGHWRGDRDPFFLETSCPGVFAAGDVRDGSIKRVASAVGEGSMSVAFAHQVIAEV